jgi:hypothetical protein
MFPFTLTINSLNSNQRGHNHMSGPNQHITKFLNYYCTLDQPEYAVLINGSWGIGKSHFISNFIKQQPQDKLKFYSISLFGIKTLQELNSEIFSLIHPKIGSKKAQLVYRTMISALPSISLNADLDGDTKSDGSGKFDISKIAAVFGVGEQKGEKSAVFIFDDLERTSIPTKEILGFLNRYVEIFKQKVIIIANEEEVEQETQTNSHDNNKEQHDKNNPEKNKKQLKKTSYQTQKEKLIGKTFLLEPETKLAIPEIVNSLESESPDAIKNVYRRNMSRIIRVFEESGYKNLRHIKHGLRDFIRLYIEINEQSREEKDLINQLLINHLVLTIEKNAVNLLENDFDALNANNYMWDNTTIDDLNKKYSEFDVKHILLNGEVWKDIVFHSKVRKTEINNALSILMAKENIPAWQVLWNYWELSNDEFDGALRQITEALENNTIENVCELIQSFGLLIRFSSEKLYKKKRWEILKTAKQNIDVNKNLILQQLNENTDWYDPSCGSHQVIGHEKMMVQHLWRYLKKLYETHLLNEAQKEITDIFNNINERYEDWKQALCSGPWGEAKFYNLAVLPAIDKGRFVNELCYTINPSVRRGVLHTLATRIDKNKIKEEVVWICKVINKLQTELGKGELEGIEAYQLKKWATEVNKHCSAR